MRSWRWGLAALVSVTVLAGCSQPDAVEKLSADRPQDAKATDACQHWANKHDQKYLVAAKNSTVAEVGSYVHGDLASILDGHPEDEYAALCLLDYPASALAQGGLPADVGPLTLAVLSDGGSLWVAPGSKP